MRCDQNNVLRVDFSKYLGFGCITTFQPWEQGIAWSSSAEDFTVDSPHTKNESLPNAHVLNEPGIPFNALRNSSEASPWYSTIPDEITDCILQFDHKFPGTTFSLLWCISRSKNALELFQSSPILTSMILHCAHQNQWRAQEVLTIFTLKRKHILFACGLPAKNSLLKILNKIQKKTFNAQDFKFITNLKWEFSIKLLSHIKFVDIRLIRFLSNFPAYNQASFLYQYNWSWNWTYVEMLIRDSQSMGEQLAILNIIKSITRCKTLQELSDLHERMIKRINKKTMQSVPKYTFPQPPLPDSASIQAIKDNHTLMLEGRTQHHCVASYEKSIRSGEYYVYKVLIPERATLGLKVKKNSPVVIDQLMLACNIAPSPKTHDHVNKWLKHLSAHNSS